MSGTLAIFGESKIGKTLDVGNAFGQGVYFLSCEPDGCSSIETSLGWMPMGARPEELLVDLDNPYEEVINRIHQTIVPSVEQGLVTAVAIDTLTELADRFAASLRAKGMTDARHLYPLLLDQITRIIRTLEHLGVWTIAIGHEMLPEGGRKGGMQVPGTRLQQKIPTMFSVMLHACWDRGPLPKPGEQPQPPKRVYKCHVGDPEWYGGDRWGACLPVQDLDLRPILWRRLNPGQPVPQFESRAFATAQ